MQYLGELKANPIVKRNDAVTIEEVEDIAPDALLISPGPGNPKQAGVSVDLIRWAAGKIPVLGICLGHQCIGEAWGGEIIHAPEIMHWKTSMISHSETGIFKEIKSPFEATRYHSLMIDPKSFPDDLEITAKTDEISLDPCCQITLTFLPIILVAFENISAGTENDTSKEFKSVSVPKTLPV